MPASLCPFESKAHCKRVCDEVCVSGLCLMLKLMCLYGQAMKMRELQLIPNQHMLQDPEVKLHAEQLTASADRQTMG